MLAEREAGFTELPETATGRVGFERLERLSGGRTRLYEVDFDPEEATGTNTCAMSTVSGAN